MTQIQQPTARKHQKTLEKANFLNRKVRPEVEVPWESDHGARRVDSPSAQKTEGTSKKRRIGGDMGGYSIKMECESAVDDAVEVW